MGLYFDGALWNVEPCENPILNYPLQCFEVRYSHHLLADFTAQKFVYQWKHIPSGKTGKTAVYVEYPHSPNKMARLIEYWNRNNVWEYALDNQ